MNSNAEATNETEYSFRVAMDIRAYGAVKLKANSLEDAEAQIDAQLVADHFEPHGSGGDYDFQHPSDIWVECVENEDTGEETMLDMTVPDGPWIMTRDLLQWHAAAAEAIATIQQVQERLDINNYDGEEDPFIEDCETALAMLKALPINREALKEAKS